MLKAGLDGGCDHQGGHQENSSAEAMVSMLPETLELIQAGE